jgi:hypothetical protein
MTGVNYAVYTAGTPLLTKKLVFHEKGPTAVCMVQMILTNC